MGFKQQADNTKDDIKALNKDHYKIIHMPLQSTITSSILSIRVF